MKFAHLRQIARRRDGSPVAGLRVPMFACQLKLTSAGNVTTHTLRAFGRDEMERVLSKEESL